MKTCTPIIGFVLLITSLSLVSACQKKTDTQSPDDAAIEAKAVIDKVNNTIDAAANSKMEQLENIDIADLYSSPEAYLAMNAKKPDVVTTDSGLQYRVLTTGTGPKPTTDSTVQVHYRGSFPDGTEFDSSYKRGAPTKFPVTGVIKGWTEALLMMSEGSKWELVIPPELAYGERGYASVIPPNQVLKFDVELLAAKYVE